MAIKPFGSAQFEKRILLSTQHINTYEGYKRQTYQSTPPIIYSLSSSRLRWMGLVGLSVESNFFFQLSLPKLRRQKMWKGDSIRIDNNHTNTPSNGMEETGTTTNQRDIPLTEDTRTHSLTPSWYTAHTTQKLGHISFIRRLSSPHDEPALSIPHRAATSPSEVYLVRRDEIDSQLSSQSLTTSSSTTQNGSDPFVLKYSPKSTPRQNDRLRQEAMILQRLTALNLDPLISPRWRHTIETDAAVIVTMDLCEGGDLAQLLLERGRLSESDSRPILRSLILGVDQLARLGIIHRDLKPSNIGLDREKRSVRIIDFGLSAIIDGKDDAPTADGKFSSSSSSSSSSSCALFVPPSGHRMSGVGSHLYLSPEVIIGIGHDHRLDLWTIGVVAFEMLTGSLPFQGESIEDVMDEIIDINIQWPEECQPMVDYVKHRQFGQPITTPITNDALLSSPLSFEAIAFLLTLLQFDPSHRLSDGQPVAHLLDHSFFEIKSNV